VSNEKLILAQSALKLRDIYVREVNSSVSKKFVPFLEPNEDEIRFQTRIGTQGHMVIKAKADDKETTNEEVDRFVDYRVLVGARFLDPSVSDEEMENKDLAADKIVAEISALYSVLYEIVSEVDKEAIATFGERNAPFHIWPFWREYLQSSCGKMHLPMVLLPLFMPPNSGSAIENEGSKEFETKGN